MQMEFTSVEGMNEDAEVMTTSGELVGSTPVEVLRTHEAAHDAAEHLVEMLRQVVIDTDDVAIDTYGAPMEALIEELASAIAKAQDIADLTRRLYGSLLVQYAVLPSRDRCEQ